MRSPYLVAIIIFFLATRLFNLTKIPPSLYWDEASIGYNAYSILKTGRDEWGTLLPVNFRSFGEFKLPIYIYTVALFEIIFGLSEEAVRLPAVMFSLISLVMIYLIALYLTKQKLAALLSALLFILSPWFFIFSRTGYEATAGLAFFLLGTYFFLSKDTGKFNLLISTIFFIASMYSYNSFRVVTPIFMLTLVYSHLRSFDIRQSLNKIFFISMVVFILSLAPIIRFTLKEANNSRIKDISIYSREHQPIPIIKMFLINYVTNLGPRFLFINGDPNPRSQQSGFGELYLIDSIFLLSGLFVCLKKRRNYLLPISVILISIIPAALTFENPHALRSVAAVPFLAIVSALGITSIINRFRMKYLPALVIAIYLSFFANYFLTFTTTYAGQAAPSWQYAYKELFTKDNQLQTPKKVIITDKYSQPYIYYLFYSKINPIYFRTHVSYNQPDKWGVSLVAKVDNLEFRQLHSNEELTADTLYVLDPKGYFEIKNKDKIKVKKVIYYPDQSEALFLVTQI